MLRRWPQSRRNRRAFFAHDIAHHGDVLRYDAGRGNIVHLLAHPDHAQQVLVDRARLYGRSPVYDIFRLHMGESLFTVEGEDWARMRLEVRPLFSRESLERLPEWAAEETTARIASWRRTGFEHPVAIGPELRRITLGMIIRLLFGSLDPERVDRILLEMEIIQREVHRWFDALFRWPRWLPTPGNVRFHRACASVRRQVGELLAASPAAPGLRSSHAIEHVLTFLHSGQATAAHWLTDVTYRLGRLPLLQAKLASARFEPGLDLTEAVLLESLRLAPPAWLIDRRCHESDRIGPYEIPRGSTVILAPYFIHRHPDFWTDPDQFEPERFMGARPQPAHPLAFFPFGAGPRRCIGHRMAMAQARPILRTLLSALRWESSPDPAGEPQFSVTLSPHPDLRLHCRPR